MMLSFLFRVLEYVPLCLIPIFPVEGRSNHRHATIVPTRKKRQLSNKSNAQKKRARNGAMNVLHLMDFCYANTSHLTLII